MSPISIVNLPDEILLHVFFFCLMDTDERRGEREWKRYIPTLLTISHTNQIFRELVLNESRFWSTLTISMYKSDFHPTEPGFVKLFKLFIKRSGTTNLNYEIKVDTEQYRYWDIIRLLLREQRRWQSVTINFFHMRKFVRQHHQMKMTNMPCLQKLSLNLRDRKGWIGPPLLDFSRSKQLRCLEIDETTYIEWKEVAETIHIQQLTDFKLRLNRQRDDIDFITSLSKFTNLTRLEVWVHSYDTSWIVKYFERFPPVLLQNLRSLILGTAVLLVQCFNTPSLLSLDVSLEDKGPLLYEYLQRSRPPLETLKLKMAILPNKDLLPNILRELSTVQTLIIKHYFERSCYAEPYDLHDRPQINDFWSLLSIGPSYLLPNLSRLVYYRHRRDAYEKRKEQAIILADMLVSRWKYSPDFSFQGQYEYIEEDHSNNFYYILENMKNIRDCMSNGCSLIIKSRQDYVEDLCEYYLRMGKFYLLNKVFEG